MKRSLTTLTLALFFTSFFVSQVFSAETTLSWVASPTAEVIGYKVYYNPNDSTLPFNGVEALEGPSPIDVGNLLTATLTGLRDDIPYFFAVTAYDAAGYESTYSNIISNRWAPELLAPIDRSIDEPIPATFQWTTAPAELDLRYTLYYGTDPDLVAAAAPMVSKFPEPGQLAFPLALLLASLLILSLLQMLSKRQRTVSAAGFALCLALTSCGGGGGGSDTSPSRATDNAAPSYQTVYSVNMGTSDYYQAFDLQPATTYYWKVVGTDITDPSQSYSSATAEFTTEVF